MQIDNNIVVCGFKMQDNLELAYVLVYVIYQIECVSSNIFHDLYKQNFIMVSRCLIKYLKIYNN